jgi:hypothetical protein
VESGPRGAWRASFELRIVRTWGIRPYIVLYVMWKLFFSIFSDISFLASSPHRQCDVEEHRPSTSSCLRRVAWNANVHVIHRDDVESSKSNPYRLVSVQCIVSLRRLPIRVFKCSIANIILSKVPMAQWLRRLSTYINAFLVFCTQKSSCSLRAIGRCNAN